MTDSNDSVQRAKELFIYLPVGFAMYLRDHGPTLLKVFVSRGRSEVQRGQHSVNEQIGQVRTAGEAAVESNGAPVLRAVSDALVALRDRAQEALNALGVLANESAGETATSTPNGSASGGATSGTATSTAPVTASDLVIDGYDGLSASEIVDRLEGLGRGDLEAIRTYETSHRARKTILGKIEQLTRGT